MAPFSTLARFREVLAAAPGPDAAARAQAEARNDRLTKPPRSLGRLEDLALWLAEWQGTARPHVDHPQIAVFAGNHGVTARGVSAFPAEVTVQMVANFEAGGAAINQLARAAGARLTVHSLDLDRPTADFTQGPAMTEAECVAALAAGWDAVEAGSDLLVPGEMGIGNTTSAAALACALFGGDARDWVGRGTGVDEAGLARKAEAVEAGLRANPGARGDALEALRCLGGREIAAMAGAVAGARARRVPVILDGFICTAAAAVLERAVPGALDHAQAGHQSAEAAHRALLQRLELDPILTLGMRLGEGSGAAVAIAVARAAAACQSGMASFDEAGVTG
ncbi:nicotinate-nucleotide--dimethylbenzimidazole phosphoribosyltransferase [Rubellimicrobium aerolatum]|uniref:Nicotinate-nucleotide--dimethylbenzimidazole phosphoribosyltransferase n=1 Tax=Rubellimicrobium aerolatum TaxID=490979 RepID=A0ABW0SEN3_9RHOB|nr:nicotinate-nucleotide--dimethylbenzimidazole phosphoribosyltransferase [Rubellimicrobium aerolatum]MBP1805631.1 nicotinate-nucleotide--dimethylbenzimidazole phosphoribosyltransferase [Rubellimicrobium aerolatum]